MKLTIQTLPDDSVQLLIEQQGNGLVITQPPSTSTTPSPIVADSRIKIKTRRQTTVTEDGFPIDRKLSSFFLVRNSPLCAILLRLFKVTCVWKKNNENLSPDEIHLYLDSIIGCHQTIIRDQIMLQPARTLNESEEYIELRDSDNQKLCGIIQNHHLYVHILSLKETLWKENKKPKLAIDLSLGSNINSNTTTNPYKTKFEVINNVPLLCLIQWVPGMSMLPTKISKLIKPTRFEQYDSNLSLYYYHLSTLEVPQFVEAVAATLARIKCSGWKQFRDYAKLKNIDTITGPKEMYLTCDNVEDEVKLFAEQFRHHYDFVMNSVAISSNTISQSNQNHDQTSKKRPAISTEPTIGPPKPKRRTTHTDKPIKKGRKSHVKIAEDPRRFVSDEEDKLHRAIPENNFGSSDEELDDRHFSM